MKQVVFIIVPWAVVCFLFDTVPAQEPARQPDRRSFDFGGAPEFDRPPLARSDGEKRALAALDEISQGKWYLNVTTREGRVLRQLTEAKAMSHWHHSWLVACFLFLLPVALRGQQTAPQPVGVVRHLKVLSDGVADVSSMAAWQKSFIRDGMSDREKALAAFKTKVMFAHQDAPPREYLQEAACVHDPIKTFNVYGYGMCCCAPSNVEALARYVACSNR